MTEQSDDGNSVFKPERISLQACLAALRRFPSISVLIVLGLIGCVLAFYLVDQVFASASINFKYPKADILTMAKDKLKGWGYETTGTKSEIEFDNDKDVKTFLEQSFGQVEGNRLMSTVPMWYWACKFEKDKEPTTAISFDPEGQLTRFDRTLPNDMRLPSLDRKTAELMAMSFAKKETAIDLSNWKLVQSRDVKLQERADHTFTWVDPSTDYHGADKRMEITVSGDKVSKFKFYIHLPESWLNQYKLSRSYNMLLATVAQSLYSLFILGAGVVFIRGIIKKSFSYKTALTFGAIFAFCEFLQYLNATAAIDFGGVMYKALGVIVLMGMAVGWGLAIAVLFAAAQPLYRQLCPDRWPLKDWFTFKMLRSPELIQGIILGFAVCFISFGYQVVYYLVGEKVGYWCPLQGQSYATLSLPYPFLSALQIGIHASFYEEVVFRVIGLVLLQKLFRGNFWIANFLQAAIWGFAHSYYPQQPAYARGLELTVEGLFAGWLLRRFGLLPNIVSHYLFDAIWTVSILRSAPLSVAITGLIPIAVPFIILVVSLAVSAWKGLVYPPVISAEKARKTAEFFKMLATTMGRPVGFEYNVLSKRAVIKLVVLSAMCLSAIIIARLYFAPVGTGIKPLQIGRAYAVDAATILLRNLNVSLDGCVVTPLLLMLDEEDADILRTAKFIRSQVGYDRTKELLEKLYSPRWQVTFQKEASPVSYTAKFDQAGNFKAPAFVTAEDIPGANLTEAEARQVAEKFFAKNQSEWLPIEFLDSETSKRSNRTDYTFNFAIPKGKAGKAVLVATITVHGDLVTRLEMGHRISDTWIKSHKDASANTGKSALSAVFDSYLLIGVSLLLLFFLWREGHVRWKLAIACGVALATLEIARSCNTFPRFFLSYDGNSPVPSFVTTKLFGWAKDAVQTGVGGTFFCALALAVINKYFKRSYLEGAFALAFGVSDVYERAFQRRFWIDAILIATCVILAGQASTVIGQAFQAAALEPPIESIAYYVSSIATASVSFRIFAASLMTALSCLYLSIVLPAITHKFLRGKRWLAFIVIFLCACCYCLQFGSSTGLDSLVALSTMLWFFAYIFILFFVGRRNFLASALVLWWSSLLPAVVAIAKLAFPLLIFDWCILVGLCLLPILWFIYLQVAPSPESLALQEATSGIQPPEP